MKAVGKTHFIQNRLIPELDDYLIFDFSNEYLSFDKKKLFPVAELKETLREALKVIEESSDNTTLIIEDAPRVFSNNMKLLWDAVENKSVIITIQSIQRLPNERPQDKAFFDEIYYLGTMDSDEIRTRYIAEQMAKGVKFRVMLNAEK